MDLNKRKKKLKLRLLLLAVALGIPAFTAGMLISNLARSGLLSNPNVLIFLVAAGLVFITTSLIILLIIYDFDKDPILRVIFFNVHRIVSIAGLAVCSLFLVDLPDNFDPNNEKDEAILFLLFILFVFNFFAYKNIFPRVKRMLTRTNKNFDALANEQESKVLEFKETFSVDTKKDTKEDYIEFACLKSIVAFLNSDGGSLLVGINDNNERIGMSKEIDKYYKSDDKFLLHVKNKIKNCVGEEFYPFIRSRLEYSNGLKFLWISTTPSDKEVFLRFKNEERFFVRTDPATDELTGKKLLEYTRKRFPK